MPRWVANFNKFLMCNDANFVSFEVRFSAALHPINEVQEKWNTSGILMGCRLCFGEL
jgi:hypothetical protein